MTSDEYQNLAMRTQADQEKISKRIYCGPPSMIQADNACRGLIADAGEVAGCIQKWIEYGRDLDKVNLMEELGDCLWRIAQMCDAMGWTLEEVMRANIAKLATRYPLKYEDHLANNRDISAEQKAIETCAELGHRKGREFEQQVIDRVVHGAGWAEPSLPDDIDTPSSHLTPDSTPKDL